MPKSYIQSSGGGGGTIDGSGTANTITKWSDADTIADAAGLTTPAGETLRVTAQNATDLGLVVRGAASQSGMLFTVENSAGTDIFRVDPNTYVYATVAYTIIGTDAVFGNTLGDGSTVVGFNTAQSVKFRDNGGAISFQVDSNATAGNTRMLVYDVDNATLERVSVGVADSGGAGYKVLRIPN